MNEGIEHENQGYASLVRVKFAEQKEVHLYSGPNKVVQECQVDISESLQR